MEYISLPIRLSVQKGEHSFLADKRILIKRTFAALRHQQEREAEKK